MKHFSLLLKKSALIYFSLESYVSSRGGSSASGRRYLLYIFISKPCQYAYKREGTRVYTMRAVVQRVKKASVSVSGKEAGSIKKGLLVFLGVGTNDTRDDLNYMVSKIANLRAFQDENGKMNLNLLDIGGDILVVSQFTLFGDCRKGRRPSFTSAAPPDLAQNFYNDFISEIQQQGIKVSSGVFQEMMEVSLVNDGPVTFLLDSKKLF
jgi:D-tyrosyl-tRNA(Tyr) deacylase